MTIYSADLDNVAEILGRDHTYHTPWNPTEYIHPPTMNILTLQDSAADSHSGDYRLSDSIAKTILKFKPELLVEIEAPDHFEIHRRYRAFLAGRLAEALKDSALFAEHKLGASIGRDAKDSEEGAKLVSDFNRACDDVSYMAAEMFLAEMEQEALEWLSYDITALVDSYALGQKVAVDYNGRTPQARMELGFPDEPCEEINDHALYVEWSQLIRDHLERTEVRLDDELHVDCYIWGFIWGLEID